MGIYLEVMKSEAAEIFNLRRNVIDKADFGLTLHKFGLTHNFHLAHLPISIANIRSRNFLCDGLSIRVKDVSKYLYVDKLLRL